MRTQFQIIICLVITAFLLKIGISLYDTGKYKTNKETILKTAENASYAACLKILKTEQGRNNAISASEEFYNFFRLSTDFTPDEIMAYCPILLLFDTTGYYIIENGEIKNEDIQRYKKNNLLSECTIEDFVVIINDVITCYNKTYKVKIPDYNYDLEKNVDFEQSLIVICVIPDTLNKGSQTKVLQQTGYIYKNE